jgi:DNA-binding NtrC family response regulator
MITGHRKEVLLVVDDNPQAIITAREPLEETGYEVLGATSVSEASRLLEDHFFDLLLLDERLNGRSGTKLLESCRDKYPGLAGIIITGDATLERAVAAMRAGARDLLQKPINKELLLDAVRRALTDTRLTREGRYDRWRATLGAGFADIVGDSPALQKVLETLRSVAASNAAVVLQGESGTGKELAARAIHAAGPRRNKPFVSVNAGAIPPTLMESTLFGSKKGSYTNAFADTVGVFEAADGGTLFLDEIGETTLDVQVRLLRVLQEKTINRVGDIEPRNVDVRIIAASNRTLQEEVEAQRFRKDLYFRLAVFTVTLPPLRQRMSDIERLSRHMLEKHARTLGRLNLDFAPGCFEKLRHYHWPGNIRELENVIQRAVILCESKMIDPQLLLLDAAARPATRFERLLDLDFRNATVGFERLYFRRLLEEAGNNKTKAAERARLDRTVLYSHLKKISLDDDSEREPS